jgi:hypothetical protein
MDPPSPPPPTRPWRANSGVAGGQLFSIPENAPEEPMVEAPKAEEPAGQA